MKKFWQSSWFPRRPQNLTKSSLSIWQLLDNVKLTVKISSIFVAFLENMNFKTLKTCPLCKVAQYWGQVCQRWDFKDKHKLLCVQYFKPQKDLGEKAKKILHEKGHDVDRSSLQVLKPKYFKKLSSSSSFLHTQCNT